MISDEVEYENLLKFDEEISLFMNQYNSSRDEILDQAAISKELIVALSENMSKDIEERLLQTSSEIGNDIRGFKEKNASTNQQSFENLKNEKKKKLKELDILKSSEPKLLNELKSLKDDIERMKTEMNDFEDMDGLHRAFDKVKIILNQDKVSYSSRRDLLKQQISKVALENESIRKSLASHDTAKELEETEKRLKHYER